MALINMNGLVYLLISSTVMLFYAAFYSWLSVTVCSWSGILVIL